MSQVRTAFYGLAMCGMFACTGVASVGAVGDGGGEASNRTGASSSGGGSGSGSGGAEGGSADAGCSPAPGSCDAPAWEMSVYDRDAGCLVTQAPVPDVCITTVNRCAPSMGIGMVCAFSPDGSVYIAQKTDNEVPTAKGWHFATSYSAYPYPFPEDQRATAEEFDLCATATCAHACPASKVPPFTLAFACPDAGP